MIAQGLKQIMGKTYDETFSTILNFTVITFFFPLLFFFKKWSHLQCNIKYAYSYASLAEIFYVSQFPHFVENESLVYNWIMHCNHARCYTNLFKSLFVYLLVLYSNYISLMYCCFFCFLEENKEILLLSCITSQHEKIL